MQPTLEARRDYAANMIRLGLWYAHRQAQSGADLRESVTKRSPIYRLTILWDGSRHPASGWRDERWEETLDQLYALYASSADGADFEEEGARILWPLAEPRVKADAEAWPWVPEGYAPVRLPDDQVFGFWAYEPPQKQDTVGFHMANPFCPESPFSDRPARAKELADMAAAVQARFPNVEYLATGSWLNSFPPFLEFFPEDWVGAEPPSRSMGIYFGSWGQFVARDGGFHRRNAERFRLTGEVPYPSRKGRCGISDLTEHLAARWVV